MKTTYKRSQLKTITYYSYKYFNNAGFGEVLLQIECNEKSCDESFKDCTSSRNIMNEQAPQKKSVRGNQLSFMNKTLLKSIMQRYKLRIIFFRK